MVSLSISRGAMRPPRGAKPAGRTPSGGDAPRDVLAESLRAGADHGRIEPGREGGQGRVKVEGQVGVGPGGPAVVRGPAGGQGGAADGERVERVRGLAEADRGEVADGSFPRVVVDGGAGLQGRP